MKHNFKIKISDFVYYFIYIYLMLNFFVLKNDRISKIVDLFYFTIMIIFIIIYLAKNKIKITKKEFISIIVIFSLIILQFIMSKYGISDILKNTVVLFIVYFLYTNKLLGDSYNNKKYDIAYGFTVLFLITFLIKSYINGTLMSNTNGLANNFYLLSVGDKNLSSVVIFLFFYFCYKRKYIIGILISIIYIFFLGSRMLYIGFLLFAIIEIIRKYKIVNIDFLKKKILPIIILSQLFMIGLSYYITYNVSINNISSYKSGLLDSSNAMRVRSNVYALETIRDNLHFIIYGYDSQILNILGVSDISNSTRYLGYRLVQPHSLLLNLLLRYGLIYSIVYICAIAYIIKNTLKKENISLFISYLFMNMILHSLFSGLYLLFFTFDMILEKKYVNKKEKLL